MEAQTGFGLSPAIRTWWAAGRFETYGVRQAAKAFSAAVETTSGCSKSQTVSDQ
jgi:hypothetical protein